MRLRLLPTHPTSRLLRWISPYPHRQLHVVRNELALDAEAGFAAVLQWPCDVAILEVRHAQTIKRGNDPNRQNTRSERGRQSRRSSETVSHHAPLPLLLERTPHARLSKLRK